MNDLRSLFPPKYSKSDVEELIMIFRTWLCTYQVSSSKTAQQEETILLNMIRSIH